MKTKHFLLACMTTVLACCGNEPTQTPYLNTTEANLSLNGDVHALQLKALNYKGNCTYESENPFVVTISDDGYLTPQHVGTTKVNVILERDKQNPSTDTLSAIIHVIGQYDTYVEPLTDITLTREQVVDKLGQPTRQTSGTAMRILIYGDAQTDKYITAYTFYGQEERLAAIAVYILQGITEKEVRDFLSERYKRLDSETYINSDSEETATLEVDIDTDATYLGKKAIEIYYVPFAEHEEWD